MLEVLRQVGVGDRSSAESVQHTWASVPGTQLVAARAAAVLASLLKQFLARMFLLPPTHPPTHPPSCSSPLQASEGVFVPLTVGGGIREFTDANGKHYSALQVAAEYFR